jgi:hypothetical protein
MLLAEYNSMNATGGKIDLSKRKTTFVYTKNGTTVTATSSKAVLSASDAAGYSADNIFGSWKPANLTVQQAAPVVSKSGSALKWDDNTDALCWVVFRDGKYFKCVTTPTVDMASGTGIYIVKAANAMGGLGAASNAVSADGTPVLSNNPVSSGLFSVQLTPVNNVVSLSIPSGTIGSTLRILSANGRTVLVKRLDSMMSEIDLSHNAAGSYIFEINRGNPTDIVYSQTVAVR